MKILCVGDLVGENGLQKLRSDLKNIQEAENIDFTIVNAEWESLQKYTMNYAR